MLHINPANVWPISGQNDQMSGVENPPPYAGRYQKLTPRTCATSLRHAHPLTRELTPELTPALTPRAYANSLRETLRYDLRQGGGLSTPLK
jgi:hypothetical protein